MIGSSFMEEFDSEMCGDFFDHIDDLLDFSNDDLEPVVGDGLEDWPSADVFAAAASTLSEYSTEEQLPGVLSVPCDDMAELEWLSNFVDDSFSAGDTEPNHGKDSQFRTSSPVSVLERSSCSGKTFPLCPETNFPGRARTKRPRPASFSGRSIPIISPTCSETGWTLPVLGRHRSPSPANSDHFVESQPPKKITKSGTGKKKRKLLENQPPLPVRKCLHCEIQKTPQWRTGPMGPKTLCNACGVRYKSGRLFPEYRPAASPTFLATKHSNSHKKVIEMRVKLGKRSVGPEPVPESNRLLEFSVSESEFMLQCAPMVSYV